MNGPALRGRLLHSGLALVVASSRVVADPGQAYRTGERRSRFIGAAITSIVDTAVSAPA